MEKPLTLLMMLCVSLAACMYENENINNYSHDSISQLDLRNLTPTQNENGSGLRAALTSSNEFGVGFLLRNETEKILYYNDDFRMDSVVTSETNNPAGVQFIRHGSTKEAHVSWGASRPTGTYTFECDFFLDVNLTELYTTLVLEFDVIEWYHFAEDAQLIAANLQERHDSHLGERLAFLIAGGASKVIVPTSEVAVSRTEVSFNTANMSAQSFIHGSDYHLLIYENGWKPAPTIIDSWGVPSLGFGIRMRGGEIIEDRFNFEFWHGALANGRYMIIRQHAEDHMRPGAPRVQETLMVEFIINNNTPINLMLQLHPQAWSSVGKIYHPVYSTHLGRDIGSKATPRKKAAMGIASAKPLTAPSPARMLTCAK